MLEIIKEGKILCRKCTQLTEILLWSDDTDGEEQQYYTTDCECGEKLFANKR